MCNKCNRLLTPLFRFHDITITSHSNRCGWLFNKDKLKPRVYSTVFLKCAFWLLPGTKLLVSLRNNCGIRQLVKIVYIFDHVHREYLDCFASIKSLLVKSKLKFCCNLKHILNIIWFHFQPNDLLNHQLSYHIIVYTSKSWSWRKPKRCWLWKWNIWLIKSRYPVCWNGLSLFYWFHH